MHVVPTQVFHMSSLLDSICLHVSRITRELVPVSTRTVEERCGHYMRSLMPTTGSRASRRYDTKKHTLRVERPETPVTLEVDPVQTHSGALQTLLTNAVK